MPNTYVIPEGLSPSRTFFVQGDPCLGCPFAKKTLAIRGTQGVFLGRNFITITKDPQTPWESLKPQIVDLIEQAKEDGFFEKIVTKVEPIREPTNDCGISKQVRELIDTRVRPAVAQDGGDIVFDHYRDGIVYVSMQGACAGCPSSVGTLKLGIERMLKYYVPEIIAVEQI